MGRLAFVTGGTGFIGRFLVDRLIAHGWNVRAFVRPTSDTGHLSRAGAELHVGELEDPRSLERAIGPADTVYHLAAVTAARTAAEYERANAAGTRALVSAITETEPRPRRLVYLSSYAACGPSRPGQPRSAEIGPEPITAYGRTKLAGEIACRAASQVGVEVVILRAPVVYGPGDRALLPYFRMVRWRVAPRPAGEDRMLHLIFAPDLATALVNAAEAPGGTYAVAEPTPHLWDDVVSAIADSLERRPLKVALPPVLVRAVARAAEATGRFAGSAVAFNREKAEEMLAPAWVCDLANSEVLLPARSFTPLRSGVESTTRWYRRQGWL